ncbi:MAG: thioredoxin family protein [Eubacteriales bacterium]|jgi:small redox-active disulfide protein 2|nr:thioredoxin family protein [Eubacteriales bacterium]
MQIKVLGGGCKNCHTLADNVKLALEQAGIEADVQSVTDIQEIMAYGVMSTPALVIDKKVVSAGRVLKPGEIVELLMK